MTNLIALENLKRSDFRGGLKAQRKSGRLCEQGEKRKQLQGREETQLFCFYPLLLHKMLLGLVIWEQDTTGVVRPQSSKVNIISRKLLFLTSKGPLTSDSMGLSFLCYSCNPMMTTVTMTTSNTPCHTTPSESCGFRKLPCSPPGNVSGLNACKIRLLPTELREASF